MRAPRLNLLAAVSIAAAAAVTTAAVVDEPTVFSLPAHDDLNSIVSPLHTCVSIDVTTASDNLITSLTDKGWEGTPADGIEALYHPNCFL